MYKTRHKYAIPLIVIVQPYSKGSLIILVTFIICMVDHWNISVLWQHSLTLNMIFTKICEKI